MAAKPLLLLMLPEWPFTWIAEIIFPVDSSSIFPTEIVNKELLVQSGIAHWGHHRDAYQALLGRCARLSGS